MSRSLPVWVLVLSFARPIFGAPFNWDDPSGDARLLPHDGTAEVGSSAKETAEALDKILSAQTLKEVPSTQAELKALLRRLEDASVEDELRPAYRDRTTLIVAQAQAEVAILIAVKEHPLPEPIDMKTLSPAQWALLVRRLSLFDIAKDLGWGRKELDDFLRLTARPLIAGDAVRELEGESGGLEFARLQFDAVRTKAMTALNLSALKPVAESSVVIVTSENYAAEVEGSALPVVIDYAAVWCDNCRVVEGVLEGLAREYKGRVKFARIDVDAAPALADEARVKGLPTVVFLKNGREIDRRIGLDPFGLQNLKNDYESDIRELLKGS
ncbi:MAG: thioredoxin family protein [Elusimicrobiota bacterium]